MLEIGVLAGASIKTWHEYFTRARIVGVDERAGELDETLPRYYFHRGSQADLDFLHDLVRQYRFRIVIDDGSHLWGHQIFTFETLFPWLQEGGIYVCEDIQTGFGAYSERYHGGAKERAADYFLRLARALAAGKAEPVNQSEDPRWHYLVTKARSVLFITHCVIITS